MLCRIRAIILLLFALTAPLALVVGQIYPWGPETQWTRTTWPALKLPFPYQQLRKVALEDGLDLHTLNGPYSLTYHERAAAQMPAKLDVVGRRPPTVGSKKAVLRCSICNVMITTMWETARHILHQTGEVPTKKHLGRLMSSACKTEIPGIMKAVGVVSGILNQADQAGRPAFSDANKIISVCQEITQGGEEQPQESSVQLSALQRGLRQYTSQINKQNAPAGKHGVFDDVPDMQSCQDYNSDCRKWAARGECQRNPLYMVGVLNKEEDRFERGHCRFSCGICLAPLPSGELPPTTATADAAAKWLEDVQYHACNASGICEGVDPGVLPVVAAFPLAPNSPLLKPGARRRGERGVGAPSTAATGGSNEAFSELRQLARALPKDQCFYTNMGWWTYEVCLERHVKQFHMDLETVRLEEPLLLGAYRLEGQPEQDEGQVLGSELLLPGHPSNKEAVPYIRQLYQGGSPCYLESEDVEMERETEVRLACSPDAETRLAIHEPQQCRYLIILFSPLLCPGSSLDVLQAADAGLEGLNLLRQEL